MALFGGSIVSGVDIISRELTPAECIAGASIQVLQGQPGFVPVVIGTYFMLKGATAPLAGATQLDIRIGDVLDPNSVIANSIAGTWTGLTQGDMYTSGTYNLGVAFGPCSGLGLFVVPTGLNPNSGRVKVVILYKLIPAL